MNYFILFLVASLPVLVLGLYIYKKDRNKEPKKLLLKLFLGGILSCFMVLIISALLEILIPFFSYEGEKLNLLELFVQVFIGIALVEEVCKWVISYNISFSDHNFDEIYDMIVYCVFVSLGFAFFENLSYVLMNGMYVGILRAVSAVPGHACYGVFMGYYLGVYKLNILNNRLDLKKKNIFLSIFVPVILHGFYDFCLFSGNFILILIFFVFLVFVYLFTVKKIMRISSINRKMKYKDNYCSICGRTIDSDYCPSCGKKND